MHSVVEDVRRIFEQLNDSSIRIPNFPLNNHLDQAAETTSDSEVLSSKINSFKSSTGKTR